MRKVWMRLCCLCVLTGWAVVPTFGATVKDGLLVYLSFDKAQGDKVADMSGNGRDGVLSSGASIVQDVKKHGNGALRIDGGQQLLTVETFKELETYQDNTFLFWIYFPVAASGGWDQILAKTAPGSDRSPGLWVETGGLGIHYRYEPGNLGFFGLGPDGDGSKFEQKKWYHVAGVTKGAELTGYVDGKSKGKIAVPAKMTQGAGGLYVGDSPAYAGPAAKFVIDELVVFNRALGEDDVTSVMNGTLLSVSPKGRLTTTWAFLKQ